MRYAVSAETGAGYPADLFNTALILQPSRDLTVLPARDYVGAMTVKDGTHLAAGGLVASDPGILGGTPVFQGTRMPVKTLFDYLADGLSLDYFLESFPSVTREQAAAVLRYGWQRIEGELAK